MTPSEDRLFREDALNNYLRAEEGGEPLRISPPWTWGLYWTMAGILFVALAFSVLGRFEVTTRARGILRPLPGIQVITAQVGGTVAQVNRPSGSSVKPGDALLRLDSASLQSQLLETERNLQILESDFRAYANRMDHYYGEQESTLQKRLQLLTQQEESQRASIAGYQRKVTSEQLLEKDGLSSMRQVDEAKESLSQAQRQWMASQQSLVQARQELAGLRSNRENDLWRREQEVQVARSKRDALKLSLSQTEITAPREGTLEAVLVKVGDVIQQGAPVGRIVPQGGPLRVISFLPEKDRAFVKPGNEVRVELDQLPYAEFGTLRARVVRVSDDLASAQEFQEAMGDLNKPEGSMFRVELDLEAGGGKKISEIPIRSGMLLNVRFTLRRQKPLTMILEPLKRWLD
jgi:multidrug resistance efflux pump